MSDIIVEVSDLVVGTLQVGATAVAVVNVVGGVAGPAGASGAGFNHTQSTVSDTWTINHNLGYKPAVQTYTVGGVEVEGDVVHINTNQTMVYFTVAIAGFARLS